MSRIDDLIRGEQAAFAMKAFALRPGESLQLLPYVRLILWYLDKVLCGSVKRLVVTLPPRHGKTFLCSISFAAWILAHNPAAKILIISYGQELADKIAYDIRAILQCEWFRRLFINAGGGVRSVSLEGGVTGLGADYIIIDDAVQIKDADNDKQLERVNALFDAEIRTRLNNPKKGAIVIVAHRLAENDLPGHVLAEGGCKLVKLPLIAPRARTYKTDDGFVWHRRKGELLRPDAFTTRDIGRLRRTNRPDFQTLQQQNPGERDRLRVKAEHFGLFRPGDAPPDAPVVLSIDPGQKGGPNNSYHVVQAWASRDGRHLLVDQWRDRGSHRDFRDEVRSFIRRWRPSAILIEATGNGLALLSDIRPQVGMQVVPITPVDDKVTRLRRNLKTLRAGAVYIPEFALWREIFVAELTAFPYGEFDDQVDALSQYLDWAAENPCLVKRPPRAVAAGISGHGMPLVVQSALWSVSQTRGAVLVRRRMR